MASWRGFEDLAHVRLLKSIGTDALAGHARPALTTQLVAPGPRGMIFADPSYPKAGAAIRIDPSEKVL